ncbi:glycoside hydrolase family 61 protein [Daldinia decipiens]|uniref:glycoside hydrolase family 61 protein n=1 Tax=Daldinia decipiens TaxID=326647 RepID=UPI0020C3E2D7|nr:glycoside hydrolase family 61 protein [Daldinia decipiens]KAI1656742.1 glycoside hydrolase family 61 protein [Daldinia decipiens]
MKSAVAALALSTLAATAAGHATFQELWVAGKDEQSTCARLPANNNPVTSVTSNDIRCNVGGTKAAAAKCTVAAGDTVTVEMHQQPGDRDCSREALGGNHFGPVIAYLSKVSDAASADGSSSWFKIFEVGYDPATKTWGNDILNKGCGKQDVKIPSDIAPGDYLLRAETIALHTASQAGGAQFYMTCYQITVTGGGSANPPGVKFPGAYSANDPGIKVDIWGNGFTEYKIPGPAVYKG